MRKQNVEMEERDLAKNPLSEDELDRLIGARPHTDFLNTRNELYRARGMKEKPPSRDEAIRLMAKEPNLLRRPILQKGRELLIGWDEAAAQKLIRK